VVRALCHLMTGEAAQRVSSLAPQMVQVGGACVGGWVGGWASGWVGGWGGELVGGWGGGWVDACEWAQPCCSYALPRCADMHWGHVSWWKV
jgi:hypothetical protein